MNYFLLTIVLFFTSVSLSSQNIVAKIINENTKDPIAYVAIKVDDFHGVISNEEGFFTLNVENLDTVTISCLGYKSKILNIDDIRAHNNIISLEEAINELDEVFISNKKPNVDSIMTRVRRKLDDNYDFNLNTYSVFFRETTYLDFKNLEFHVEKASVLKKRDIEKANTSLDSLSNAIMENKTLNFLDFKGKLLSKDYANSKLAVSNATKLIDRKNDFSIDDVQERAQKLVYKYLDTTKTYKLKSGLFKIEDSMSLKSDKNEKSIEKNEYQIDELNSKSRALLSNAEFYDNSFLTMLLDSDLYEYTLEKTTYYNRDLIYIISYKPRKSKGKYTGSLYITDNEYAITKVDYQFAKNRHGEKLNLRLILGIKYVENINNGTLIYEKDSINKYQPKYLKQDEGRYFYVSRDFTLIENTRAKNKVSFSFKIEGDIRNKEELLIIKHNKITLEDYNNLKVEKVVPYQLLNKFDATIWENEETIEPLEEMKQFNKSVEKH
ncbi:carboxypeptidase-like regulatory domain-containing protein [Flavobacteriaceae bacterium LMO-SS05]